MFRSLLCWSIVESENHRTPHMEDTGLDNDAMRDRTGVRAAAYSTAAAMVGTRFLAMVGWMEENDFRDVSKPCP